MPRKPRKPRCEVTDPESVQVFHLVQRCVRRAWLCGEDPHSGQSYEHRRSWIRSRLEFLASIFAIDCLTYYCAQQLHAFGPENT